MTYEEIQYAVADRVLTITLHRPERLNAFTARMCRELLDACDRADADDEVRVVVITGAGRGFCAGADLSSGGGTFDYTDEREGLDDHRDGGGLVTLRLFEMKKPLIAAINGPAVGVGITMTLPMDVRLASNTAKFGFVFARRGIVPEACSSYFLPRIAGISRALEWTYTGRVFGPERSPRRRLGHPRAAARGAAARGVRAGARDRRQHLGDVGHAHPRPDVAHARRGAPDGGAPGRLEMHLLDGPLPRCPRGRARLPRKARAELQHVADPRPAGVLPLVAGAEVQRVAHRSVLPGLEL